MPVKKKVTKKSRINPAVPKIDFDHAKYIDLSNGDCFLLRGKLWMKFDIDDQEAVNLENGDFDCNLCDEVVIPVEVTINWRKK